MWTKCTKKRNEKKKSLHFFFFSMDDVGAAGFKEASAEAIRAAEHVIRASGRHGFPFGLPVSIERERHLSLFTTREFWATPKIDGTRVAVIFSDKGPVLMDRARTCYALSVDKCPGFFARGTLMDGELAFNDVSKTWQVLVFDLAAVAGVPVTDPLSKRLGALQALCPCVISSQVALVCKPMVRVTVEGLAALQTLLPHFRADGVIFTPEAEGPTRPGMAPHVLKMKTVHTLDLLWTDGGLWFGDAATTVPVSSLRPRVITTGFPPCPPTTATVIEAAVHHVSDQELHLHFQTLRPKKSDPNNTLCVTRTLVSAIDNLTIADIVHALSPLAAGAGTGTGAGAGAGAAASS